MPVLNPTDQAPPKEDPVPVQVTAPTYKGVTVDTSIQPVHSLLTHVEGQSWTTDYFSQVKTVDNELSGQNETREGAYQQYIRIRGLEQKVNQPLTTQQDEQSNSFNVRGQSTLYPGVTPNAGDMFLADIGDGREAVFQVTRSTRMSIFTAPTFQIEYVLKGYSDDLIGDLQMKTVKTVYFVKDYIQHGMNPILEEEDYRIVGKLSQRYYDIIRDYYRNFYSPRYSTLIIPGQESAIYDAFLMDTLRQLFETRHAPEIIKIKNLNISGDQVMKSETLWTALMRRERRILPYCAQRMGLASLYTFRSQGMLEGIYYTSIKYVVYPKAADLSIDDALDGKIITCIGGDLKHSGTRARLLSDAIPLPALDGLPQYNAELYKLVTVDDYYILSEDFYKDTDNKSALEILVYNYLDGKAISPIWLMELAESYRAMGGLERFYYGPIILFLIKATLRSI